MDKAEEEDMNEIQQRIKSNYALKQKQLGEILQIILTNPSVEVIEKNLEKIQLLIDVVPDLLEFRIKIISSKELLLKPKKPVVK